jgi:hypothetical protein
MKIHDINIEGSDYLISLHKLIGKPIKDIQGYLTSEFGDVTFKMSKVEFADGTFLGCEGEHDLPYLVGFDEQPNFDDETLQELYDQEKEDENE